MAEQHKRLHHIAEEIKALATVETEHGSFTRMELNRFALAIAVEADIAHDAEMRRVPLRPVRPTPRPWWKGLFA